jgi:hypothetical protein
MFSHACTLRAPQVLDCIIARYDAPNAVYYGDPLRPGDFTLTQHDEFGLASDGTIKLSAIDIDGDAATPPEIVLSNENALDKILLGLREDQEALASVTGGTGLFLKKYKETTIDGTDTSSMVRDSIYDSNANGAVLALGSPGGTYLTFIDPTKKQTLVTTSGTIDAASLIQLDGSDPQEAHLIELKDATGDGNVDVVLHIKDDTDGTVLKVYEGTFGVNSFVRTDIGTSSIKANEIEVLTKSITLIDENGGIHYFRRGTGSTWEPVQYPDPNIEVGSTTPSTGPHNHQLDKNTIELADFDGDSYPDALVGNELFLSTLATTKGDFSTVSSVIRLAHGATILEAVAFDADGDSDVDVMLIQGPSGSTLPPILLLNRGDGQLKKTEQIELTGLTPPVGGWKAGIKMEKIELTTGTAVLIGYPDNVTPLQILSLPTGTGAGGAILKADWEGVTNAANLVQVPNMGSHSVNQIKIEDVDGDGQEEALVVYDDSSFILFSTSGTTFTEEMSTAGPDGAFSIEVFDLDGDGSPELILGGGEDIRILWGPDPPAAKADPILNLADWQPSIQRLPYDLSGAVPSGYSIEEILVFDTNDNGYGDVVIVASNSAGDTIRKVIKVTKTEAEARDLTGAIEEDLELTGEAGNEVMDILKIDVNNDGGEPYPLALRPCLRCSHRLIL